MGKQKRQMASRRQIFEHWKAWLYENGKAEPDCVTCFACGLWPYREPMPDDWEGAGGLQRAHIVPRLKGGPDTADNLHLLCAECHRDSEFIETRDEYLAWAAARSVLGSVKVPITAILKAVE